MRIWFDTEFIDDGRTIDLISIGAVREDGVEYYAISSEFDASKASPWVVENVLAKLEPDLERRPRTMIAVDLLWFAGEAPEFWAYYADYDWVVLCQLYGTMMSLPRGWPMWCRDVKQLAEAKGNPALPMQAMEGHHNALADARWNRQAWKALSA